MVGWKELSSRQLQATDHEGPSACNGLNILVR